MLNSFTTGRVDSGAKQHTGERNALPTLEQMLVEGGDSRIALNTLTGVNEYGCPPYPDPALLALGSSTASVVSATAFAAAERMWQRLQQLSRAGESPGLIYARELHHIRNELMQLCGIDDIPGLEMAYGASGTDLHLIAGRLLEGTLEMPALAVMVDAVETGRGVPDALAGRHFSHSTALGGTVSRGTDIGSGAAMEVATVAVRERCGTPRPLAVIDAEVTSLVETAVSEGRHVLLTLVDVSQTGLIAPSAECAMALRQRWPDKVDVLVDACQFRLAPASVRAYIQHGFILALTGSKFISGPAFAGAMFFPAQVARRLKGRLVPRGMAAYSSRAEWPQHWAGAGMLTNTANFGLLLRWRAALEELRAFRALPDAAVREFLLSFAHAINARLYNNRGFEPIAVPSIDRSELLVTQCWDQLQTIFPFLLRHRDGPRAGQALTLDETMRVYFRLQQDITSLGAINMEEGQSEVMKMRMLLGLPVPCGERNGVPVSALRICVSSRMIVDALSDGGINTPRVISASVQALDKLTMLLSCTNLP